MSTWSVRINRFLRVKPITVIIMKIRKLFFLRVKGLRVLQPEANVVMHQYSREKLLLGKPTDRILRLLHPLIVIDRLDPPTSRVLMVGCRFEADMLYLLGFGFNAKNVRGMDLLSYSPWVDLGDMHNTSYADESWDAVVLGWVLSYSTQQDVVAREMLRILKPGGLLAVGVTHYPKSKLDEFRTEGNPSIDTHIQTTSGLLDLFGDQVGDVYFRHDASSSDRQSPCMIIFAKKG